MNRDIRTSIGVTFALFGAAFVFATGQEACTPSRALLEKTAEVTYLGQLLQCVDRAPTKAVADACREEVRRRWLTDSGITETITDAGGDRE